MLVNRTFGQIAASLTLTLAAVGCAGDSANDDAAPGGDSVAPAAAGTPAVQSSNGAVELVEGAALQLVVAPAGNEVRYRVREQLARVELPNDAVGAATDVTGGIAFDESGKIIPAGSKFVVNIASLKSDRDRRDNYVRTRTLGAQQHPTVELAPTAVRGLSLPLPSSGARTFEVLGDLTVRGVTRPTTWQVEAQFENARVTGKASTAFTFADFDLQQPRVPIVLSVADTITLEYDFTLVPKP